MAYLVQNVSGNWRSNRYSLSEADAFEPSARGSKKLSTRRKIEKTFKENQPDRAQHARDRRKTNNEVREVLRKRDRSRARDVKVARLYQATQIPESADDSEQAFLEQLNAFITGYDAITVTLKFTTDIFFSIFDNVTCIEKFELIEKVTGRTLLQEYENLLAHINLLDADYAPPACIGLFPKIAEYAKENIQQKLQEHIDAGQLALQAQFNSIVEKKSQGALLSKEEASFLKKYLSSLPQIVEHYESLLAKTDELIKCFNNPDACDFESIQAIYLLLIGKKQISADCSGSVKDVAAANAKLFAALQKA